MRIFESLTNSRNENANSQLTSNPTARVANVRANDLTEIASRAQQRQEAILAANPGERNLFPVQDVDGSLPNLLSQTSTGASDFTPQVGNANNVEQQLAGQARGVGEDSPVSAGSSQQPAPRLTEASFEQLTPTQRLEAYGNVFADQVDAVIGDDGEFKTSTSGSPLVAFKPRGVEAYVSVAQEVVPASAMFAEALRRLRVSAQPVGSTDNAVTYTGNDNAVVALARKFGAKVARDEGGIAVQFDSTHPINTQFHENPFGETETPEGRPSDPRLNRFVR